MMPRLILHAFVLVLFLTSKTLGQDLEDSQLLCPHICVLHGTVNGARVSGNEVSITCEGGYHVAGVSKLKCNNDGTWSDEKPTCEKDITCNGITGIQYGSVDFEATTFNKPGGVMTFECDINYKLQGQNKITCQRDGTWDYPPPVCVDQRCPAFTHVVNGFIVEQDRTPGGFVKFQCNKDYFLIGIEVMKCGDNGIWQGEQPVCAENRCHHISTIEHGSLADYDDVIGSVITVTCDKGYTPDGASRLTCKTDRQWSDAVPKCVRDQDVPKEDMEEKCAFVNLKNGACTGSRDPRKKVKCRCNDGFKLKGRKMYRCNKRTIQWQKMKTGFPTCVVQQCPPVDFIKNAIVKTKAAGLYAPGVRVRITCEKGFILDGNRTMVCQKDAKWSSPPRCIDKCPHQEVFENGYVLNYENRIKRIKPGRMSFGCNAGFRLDGAQRTHCNKSATWTSPFPSCIAKPTCDVPCLRRGEYQEISRRWGKTVRYTCDGGYVLRGQVRRTCRNGVWDSEAPWCEEIPTSATAACERKPLDVYFVVDISRSIDEDEIIEERNALKFLFSAFDIGVGKTRVGLIKYNAAVETEFTLGRYQNIRQLMKVNLLSRGSDFPSGTRTDLGMFQMMENFVKEGVAGREQWCVLLTDGRATRPLTKMLVELRKTDIKTIAIGVGSNADVSELRLIATGDGKENVHMASNFTALLEMSRDIVNKVCLKDDVSGVLNAQSDDQPSLHVPPAEPTNECMDVPLDVYFVMDISASISDTELKQERDCLRFLLMSLDIAPKKTRVGMVKYHRQAMTEFHIGQYQTRDAFRNVSLLTRKEVFPKGTFTDLGMNMMMDNFEKDGLEGRKKVAILMTDGRSTCKEEKLNNMIARLKRTDIRTIAVGIGNRVDESELRRIATGDGKEGVFNTSFDDLGSFVDGLLEQTCKPGDL